MAAQKAVAADCSVASSERSISRSSSNTASSAGRPFRARPCVPHATAAALVWPQRTRLAEQYRVPVPAHPASGEHRRGGSTPLVLKTAPDLGFSGFTELVAFVEGFEQELLEIEGS